MSIKNNKEKLHSVWKNMKSRCNNPKAGFYNCYGGRGIIVCDEWKKFLSFYNDMVADYKSGLELDRIDNNGSYSKENCRWTDRKTQINNSRIVINARHLSYLGISDTVRNWAKYLGINRTTLDQRVRCGWSMERIINYN